MTFPKYRSNFARQNIYIFFCMKMVRQSNAMYEAPAMDIYEMRAELGFSLSNGSIIEQVGGRSEEEEWD